jgi:hypothetical protein
MANESQLDRWSQVLVEASILGDLAACKKYGVSDRSLRNWRSWLKTMPRLRQLYEAKMSRVGAEFSDSLTTRSAFVVDRRQSQSRRAGSTAGRPDTRATPRLADAAAAEIAAIAAACGLPEVRSAERSHALHSGLVVSLFVAHRDATYTVCEVLSEASRQEDYRVLGHLLFCYESVRMHYRVPASSIRLRVLADFAARPLWNRVVANLGVEVGFVNILDVVRGRLSSQNVLASEVAQAAVVEEPSS